MSEIIKPIHHYEGAGKLITKKRRIYGNGESVNYIITPRSGRIKDERIYKPMIKATRAEYGYYKIPDRYFDELTQDDGGTQYNYRTGYFWKNGEYIFRKWEADIITIFRLRTFADGSLDGVESIYTIINGSTLNLSTGEKLRIDIYGFLNDNKVVVGVTDYTNYDYNDEFSTAPFYFCIMLRPPLSDDDFSLLYPYLYIYKKDNISLPPYADNDISLSLYIIDTHIVFKYGEPNTDGWLVILTNGAAPVDNAGGTWTKIPEKSNGNYTYYQHSGYTNLNNFLYYFDNIEANDPYNKEAFIAYSNSNSTVYRYVDINGIATPVVSNGFHFNESGFFGRDGFFLGLEESSNSSEPYVYKLYKANGTNLTLLKSVIDYKAPAIDENPQNGIYGYFRGIQNSSGEYVMLSSGLYLGRPFSHSQLIFGCSYYRYKMFPNDYKIMAWELPNDDDKWIFYLKISTFPIYNPQNIYAWEPHRVELV